MVTEEKITSHAVLRYRLGTLFIWLGILTWVPFIFLKLIGGNPPFFLFLPFHLVGVIGGSRLRAIARKELGLVPAKKSMLRLIAHGLIILGVLVWAPYLYLKLVMGQPVEVMNFLPYHLSGVLSGILLYIFIYVSERYKKE